MKFTLSEYNITSKEIEYLAIIYEFMENGLNRVTTSELASKTYVTLGAVSTTLKKLKDKQIEGKDIINYMKGYGVSLTQVGKGYAGKILRCRRITELFLNHLGFDFYAVQKEIYLITITDEVIDKIEEQFLKDLTDKRCSHGYLIPNRDGNYELEQLKDLTNYDIDTDLKIIKIPESPFYYIPQYNPLETDFFLKIHNNKLIPGKIIKILDKDPKFITIETSNGQTKIPKRGLADQIFVEKIDSN